jgi:hypothetical protein
MSQSLSQPPSEQLHVSDEYAAYCIDQAVHFLGTFIENELHNLENSGGKKQSAKTKQARQERLLQKLLGIASEGPKFRDPGDLLKK